MNKSKIDIITQLVNSIDFHKINYPIIKSNCDYLYKIFKDIKDLWSKNLHEHKIINASSIHYKPIMKIVNNSLIVDYTYVKNQLKKINQIIQLSDSNITFYYLDLGNYESDIQLINKLFSQTVCLAKYSDSYGNTPVIIIWIPVNTKRDFLHKIIDEENLELAIENFNAFTASGVTHGQNPRITIISRYEEISKLLIHELIHNFNLDGSGYHEHNDLLIKTYKKIKNPLTLTHVKNYDYAYSIYESYTELLSSYLSMIFRNIDLDKKKDIVARFEIEIFIELLYSYNTIGNLIRINGYKSYEDFELVKQFAGDICVYEYYYLKGLMYNNYELKMCNGKKMFQDNYLNIINVNKSDPLLKNVYANMKTQTNFSYIFYS
jgi:hypothetical protein